MAAKTRRSKRTPKDIEIKLTDEQKRDIVEFIKATGDAKLDIGVVFEANLERGTVAPATFMVGAAV